VSGIRSIYEVKQVYTSLRKRYFVADIGAQPYEVHALPAAADLRWYWLAKNSDCLGITNWDEDDEPDAIGLATTLRCSHHLMKHILLHEMTHIRLGPNPSCGGFSHSWTGPRISRSSAWHSETQRLVTAGAFQL
jgi:hypothetical protein